MTKPLPLYRKDNLALIENLKAFAIFFCAAHLPQGSMFPELTRIAGLFGYSTGVPLFVVLSAYFMKADIEKNTTSFIETIFSILIWVSGLYFLFALGINHSGVFNAKMPYISSAGQFYLVLLIIWKILVPYMFALHKWLLCLVLLILLIGMPMIPKSAVHLELFYSFAFYTPFFFAGILLDWKTIVRFRDSKKKHWILLYALPVLITGFVLIFAGDNLNQLFYGPCPFYSFWRFLIAIAVILLAFAYFPGYKINILHRVGSKCLIIYLFHWILLTWLYGAYVYPSFVKNNFPELAASCITFSAYCFTFWVLSFDFVYKMFFRITYFTRQLMFRSDPKVR